MLIGLFLAFGATQITIAEAPMPPVVVIPPTVQELVSKYASEKGVSQKLAHYVAKAESGYKPNKIGDRDIICKNKKSPWYGTEVYARGVFQITRCYHPEVTDEQAFDPEWNVAWGMSKIAEGEKTCKQEFSTCRRYYDPVK